MSYTFSPEEGVTEAAVRCSREQLDTAIHALREEFHHHPAEAIHVARKAVKKQRSLLRLLRGSLNSKQRSDENEALRTAARELSGARDAEVQLQTLDDLGTRFAGQVPRSTVAAVREQLERDPGQGGPSESAATADAAQRLEAVEARIANWELRADGWAAIDSGLTRTYRRGRRAFRCAGREPSTEHTHEWRKRAKDLWYALRLLEPVCGPIVNGQAKEAHRLADLLGDDHDLAVLRARLERFDELVAADVGEVFALIDYRRGELQREAVHVGERLYLETPKQFRRRMRGYWRAGEAQATAWHERRPAQLAGATR